MLKEYTTKVKKWDVFEAQVEGPTEGNPFVSQWIKGIITGANESVVVNGFYDGDGIYKIRFMPSYEGNYTFIIKSSFSDEAENGSFYVEAKDEDNHGPVRVSDTYHFAYEDGTPYYPIGTTAYVWHLQDAEQVEKTLASLDKASFNKIRFCIFPKHYTYNFNEPCAYPYVGTPMDSSVLTEDNFMDYFGTNKGNDFDYQTFNPVYFQHLENCIVELGKIGIEADLILFHPYDRWRFSSMSQEEDDLYVNYVVNRLSAYHNVWWSLANEYDLLKDKTTTDWERIANIIVKRDIYHHLRSIHNCRTIYDQNKPWITHVSYQRVDLYKGAEYTDELRYRFNKPVVMDEIAYEGVIPHGWGNITPEELTRRSWESIMRGGYPGHSETYPVNEKLWWSHGGDLQGESWKRMGLLKDVLEDVPGNGLSLYPDEWDSICAVPSAEWSKPIKSQYIYYYSFMRPSSRTYHIDDETDYVVEIIDTYDMKITRVGIYQGKFTIELPIKPYIAVRLTKATEEDYLIQEEEDAVEETVVEEVAPEDNEDILKGIILDEEEESIVEDEEDAAFEEVDLEEDDITSEEEIEEEDEEVEEESDETDDDEYEEVEEDDDVEDFLEQYDFDDDDEVEEESSIEQTSNGIQIIDADEVEEDEEVAEIAEIYEEVEEEEIEDDEEEGYDEGAFDTNVTEELDVFESFADDEDELPDIVTEQIPVVNETLNIPVLKRFNRKDEE